MSFAALVQAVAKRSLTVREELKAVPNLRLHMAGLCETRLQRSDAPLQLRPSNKKENKKKKKKRYSKMVKKRTKARVYLKGAEPAAAIKMATPPETTVSKSHRCNDARPAGEKSSKTKWNGEGGGVKNTTSKQTKARQRRCEVERETGVKDSTSYGELWQPIAITASPNRTPRYAKN